ncbi:MAG: hypothetical protein ACKPIB_29745, partial [Dolichospermum sp.]
EGVDWECEVLTNYSDVNLGCKIRVSGGLDWVFSEVEEAIILEDDCLPHPSFFPFCEELLEYYRQDSRVMHISGCNYGIPGTIPSQSYYFSQVTGIWGWATWRRAWNLYNNNTKFWLDINERIEFLQGIFKNQKEFRLRFINWQKVYSGKIDTWDYQWHLTSLCYAGLSIKPNCNLITNIGFSSEATHTKQDCNGLSSLIAEDMCFPISHPKFMLKDVIADNLYFQKMHGKKFILIRLIEKLKMMNLFKFSKSSLNFAAYLSILALSSILLINTILYLNT